MYYYPRVLLHLLHIQTIRNIQMLKYNRTQYLSSTNILLRKLFLKNYVPVTLQEENTTAVRQFYFIIFCKLLNRGKTREINCYDQEASIAETMFAVFSHRVCVQNIYQRGNIDFFFHVGRTTVVFLSNDESGTRNF